MKVLHFGSYWMGDNDIVSLMVRVLSKRQDIELKIVDPRIYRKIPNKWIEKNGQINWIKDKPLFEIVDSFNPDLIICNAGGLSPTEHAHQILESRGVLRVGIALSDPDDFFVRSKYFAKFFNIFFTNAQHSIEQYKEISVNAILLPFAADETYHHPLSKEPKYDVVIVGGKRPDREILVNMLKSRNIKVGCYGSGWITNYFPFNLIKHGLGKHSNIILKYFDWIKEVHGSNHNIALNTAPLYISFSGTYSGYTNVKVGLFEAASAGNCCLVENFTELHNYFISDEEVVTFNSFEDAVNKIVFFTENRNLALNIGKNARKRILTDHTWSKRWDFVFKTINNAHSQ